jgi:hypothetical protein
MTNALELLKSCATAAPVGGKSALDVFANKIEMQIQYTRDMTAGKAVNSRLLWFRKDANGYVVRIGKNGLEVAGAKFFRATDLDAVAALLGAAGEAIKADVKLQAEIQKTATARTEKLRAGRARKKAK